MTHRGGIRLLDKTLRNKLRKKTSNEGIIRNMNIPLVKRLQQLTQTV